MANGFSISLSVRESECNRDGKVHHWIYQQYLGHARQALLRYLSVDFKQLEKKKIDLIVMKETFVYHYHLKQGDQFSIKTEIQRHPRTQYKFIQSIHRMDDNQLILEAEFIGGALNKNKPMLPDDLIALIPEFKMYEKQQRELHTV